MIVKCPECKLQVSDKAIACPHCGYPLLPNATPRKPRNKNNKRRRLPNGFGQISEIKNRNLRNSFRAMITVGKTPAGRPICKPLKPKSFFQTYNDAYTALVEYNKNPYDIDPTITLAELYDQWSEKYYASMKNSRSKTSHTSAWRYCNSIKNLKVSEIRIRHLKGCIENGSIIIDNKTKLATAVIKTKMKILFNLLFDYAIELELTDKNYARSFILPKNISEERNDNRQGHIMFTDDELNLLWANLYNVPNIDAILIQCYSGWRPQELGLIEISNVDLVKRVFIGGMKTKAGTNRPVPIHPKIYPLVERRYKEALELNSKYLFNMHRVKGKNEIVPLGYFQYRDAFKDILKKLNLSSEHKPHDGRVTFVSLAKKYNVDEYAIKYIIGHSIDDITEKIYTKRDGNWLTSEIEKIK